MLIAKRQLTYFDANGTSVPVPVEVFRASGGGRDWSCRYIIGWPNGSDEGAGHGVDEVQALIATLQLIGMRIYFSEYHRSGRLRFEEFGRGYGFPVPKNARDLLVGDDLVFDG